LVRLLQLVSPALPIGAFAYSQGLEQAISVGWVADEAATQAWVLGMLASGFGTLDLPLLFRFMTAWRAGDAAPIDRWSAWLCASRGTREARAEDRQLGVAFARVLLALGIADAAPWAVRDDASHAAMFALAAARFAVPPHAAAVGYAFAWAETLVGAAVRLVPLGQTAGQRVLAAAGDCIPAAVERAAGLPDDQLAATAPGQAVLSARHETLYSRLFRS
jgi:urease accessory protein